MRMFRFQTNWQEGNQFELGPFVALFGKLASRYNELAHEGARQLGGFVPSWLGGSQNVVSPKNTWFPFWILH